MAIEVELIEKDIISKLPQVPYVIDQVGAAIKWVKEVNTEGDYYKTISFASNVTDFVCSISNTNFFKTHLVIGALLMDIEKPMEDSRFEVFKTASQSVEKTLENLIINSKLGEERGCFNALSIHLVQLANKDNDCFCVSLMSILSDLNEILTGMKEAEVKAPITSADYIKVLGYAYTMQNIRMANLTLNNKASEILNKISIILNKDFIF